jgi:hypothetical protein
MYLHTDSATAVNNPAGGMPVTNMPAPLPAGTCQFVIITGLQVDTWYWGVIRSRDEVFNWSGWSNRKQKTPDATPPAVVVLLSGPCP